MPSNHQTYFPTQSVYIHVVMYSVIYCTQFAESVEMLKTT
jgi:hypothetical protein